MPRVPLELLDWKVRHLVGQPTLERLARDLWYAGVAAGRIEGIVVTLLLVTLLVVTGIVLFLALRK